MMAACGVPLTAANGGIAFTGSVASASTYDRVGCILYVGVGIPCQVIQPSTHRCIVVGRAVVARTVRASTAYACPHRPRSDAVSREAADDVGAEAVGLRPKAGQRQRVGRGGEGLPRRQRRVRSAPCRATHLDAQPPGIASEGPDAEVYQHGEQSLVHGHASSRLRAADLRAACRTIPQAELEVATSLNRHAAALELALVGDGRAEDSLRVGPLRLTRTDCDEKQSEGDQQPYGRPCIHEARSFHGAGGWRLRWRRGDKQ